MKALQIITLKRRLASKVRERVELYRQIEKDETTPYTMKKLIRLSEEIKSLKERLKEYP